MGSGRNERASVMSGYGWGGGRDKGKKDDP